jgi:uncharacterized membrane protein (UPF0127 family)
MRTRVALAWLSLLLALPACAAQPADDFQPAQLSAFSRGEVTIERRNGRDTFRVWLAVTPAEQQQGLMWIRRLPRDQGMLFLLEAPRPMDMWMKNTFVPLDMLFFDATGRITHIRQRTEPQSEQFIGSGGTVAGVLEILAGEAERRGIRIGDRMILPGARLR